MRDIIFVVENAIYANDGYKSRIEMEMDILHNNFKFHMIVPYDKRKIEFRHNVNIYSYKAFNEKVPFLLNMYWLRNKLIEVSKKLNNPIIYCEALPAAVAARKVCESLNLKLVFDCHGTAPDEVYLYHPNIIGKIYSNWLRKKEKQIVDKSDLLITVSKKQFELFNANKKYILLPMLPAEQFFDESNYREVIRRKLNISKDAEVYVYSGQNQKWQMTEGTLDYYKKIEDESTNSFLLILTACVDEFTELARRKEIKKVKILKVNYWDMPKYLDACDYGFCLRENHIINKVAAPTKVLEYVARNVVPILTEYVGDYSEELSEKKMAVIVNKDMKEIKEKQIINSGNEYVKKMLNECKEKYLDYMRRL